MPRPPLRAAIRIVATIILQSYRKKRRAYGETDPSGPEIRGMRLESPSFKRVGENVRRLSRFLVDRSLKFRLRLHTVFPALRSDAPRRDRRDTWYNRLTRWKIAIFVVSVVRGSSINSTLTTERNLAADFYAKHIFLEAIWKVESVVDRGLFRISIIVTGIVFSLLSDFVHHTCTVCVFVLSNFLQTHKKICRLVVRTFGFQTYIIN